MAVIGEDDRFIEAVLHRLGLGQSGVDVDAGDLGASRGGVVVDAAPRDHLAADARLDVDIVAEWRRIDGER